MGAMSEPIPDLPADESLAKERALNLKLEMAAADKRRRVDAANAAGQPSPMARVASLMSLVQSQTPRDQIMRVSREEGDQPEIAPVVRAQLIPPRFADATFADYEPSTQGQRAALNATKFWSERAASGQCAMLALIGPQGTGKSHLLYSAASALLARGVRPYSRPWYKLADELRYGGESPFSVGKMLESHEVRAMLWKQRVVLLDEVRPTASTSFDDTELAKFACWAYDAKLSVLITTNVNPLAEVMGPPAASRFTQVIIDGPDRRQA